MKLPKFWPDSGNYNDAVGTLCIMLSLLTWQLLGWWLGSLLFGLAGLFLAPLIGFFIGLTLIHVLSTYFRRDE